MSAADPQTHHTERDGLGHAPAEGAAGHTGATDRSDADAEADRLVPAARATEYGRRWDEVKGSFVDEPRRAVAQADALVGELLEDMERLFREQRARLKAGFDADQASTEDLRLALRRYRGFFDRLLTL